MDGRTLKIDRMHKITLPNSNITLPGLGLPKLPEPIKDQSTAPSHSNITDRDDLIVLFNLKPMDDAEESDGNDLEEVIDIDGATHGPTVLNSQADLDAYIKKTTAKNDQILGRKLLKFLSSIKQFEST